MVKRECQQRKRNLGYSLYQIDGRVRAMDGSADLRWRSLERRPSKIISDHRIKTEDDGGPRDGPQGRMITGFGGSSCLSQPSSFSGKSALSKIPYNHSISKERVLVPRYHYNRGPKLISMIFRQCWCLNYLNCRLESEHPFCALKNNHHVDYLSSNVLDKWLRH